MIRRCSKTHARKRKDKNGTDHARHTSFLLPRGGSSHFFPWIVLPPSPDPSDGYDSVPPMEAGRGASGGTGTRGPNQDLSPSPLLSSTALPDTMPMGPHVLPAGKQRRFRWRCSVGHLLEEGLRVCPPTQLRARSHDRSRAGRYAILQQRLLRQINEMKRMHGRSPVAG
jgi:hypothetical protein